MRLCIFFIAFVLLICLREIQSDSCELTGEFCGRDLNRKVCCTGFYCDMAHDGSYAKCEIIPESFIWNY
jgi:hypothetical protein